MFNFICTKVGCTSGVDGVRRFCVTLLKIHEGYVFDRFVSGNGSHVIKIGYLFQNCVMRKPQFLMCAKNNLPSCNVFKECAVSKDDYDNLSISSQYGIGVFRDKIPSSNAVVKVIADFTIGKGFAGVVKRHSFKGGRRSHGDSLSERSLGSTGQQNSERVFKGKLMPGRMGGKKCSIKNVKLWHINEREGYIALCGSVAGAKNSLLTLCF